jgi:threonylcarbamoyladenosine tRNA methylthiotransferase MtaB
MTLPQPGGRRVAFKTLGCKVNRAESESAAATLLGAGWRVTSPGDAAVVVINTCTVTGEADAKARKEIRRALALPAEPVVVVTGCLAALDPDGIAGLGARVVVAPDRDRVAEEIARHAGSASDASPAAGRRIARPRSGDDSFRTRVMLKVQDGCDAFCAYCVVPHARGGPRSRPLDSVVDEARVLAARGVSELVVTGVNVGRYRHDGHDLADLLAALGATGPRIRLSSIEPMDLTGRLLETMAGLLAEHRFCPHLHIPLQTGSDALLARMGRGYDAAAYARAVAAARAALGRVAVTTDVIAGLPGETEADARTTEVLVTGIGFQRLHVFRYSARAGTPAAAMPDQVFSAVRAERAARLRDISGALSAAYLRERLGDTADLVMETADEGTSEDHLRVRLRHHGVPVAKAVPTAGLVTVVLDGIDGEVALGSRAAR